MIWPGEDPNGESDASARLTPVEYAMWVAVLTEEVKAPKVQLMLTGLLSKWVPGVSEPSEESLTNAFDTMWTGRWPEWLAED